MTVVELELKVRHDSDIDPGLVIVFRKKTRLWRVRVGG